MKPLVFPGSDPTIVRLVRSLRSEPYHSRAPASHPTPKPTLVRTHSGYTSSCTAGTYRRTSRLRFERTHMIIDHHRKTTHPQPYRLRCLTGLVSGYATEVPTLSTSRKRHPHSSGASKAHHRGRSARSISRRASRSAIASRLSYCFLPRASPRSTFARPRRMTSRSGTRVYPRFSSLPRR